MDCSILDSIRQFQRSQNICLGRRSPRAFSIKFTINLADRLENIEDKSELIELIHVVTALWVEEQERVHRVRDLLVNNDT